ncbi:MAG: PASTA domain-containing protein [Bacteroidales bacterium]|nr:PASTA domain-containing protein [Bacteroidales bacterium]
MKNILWAIGIGLTLVIALLIWLNIYTLHNESITVPDLRGLSVENASLILKNKNLRFEIVDSVFVKGKAPGAIVEQIPAPESNVKEGRIVFLSINGLTTKKVQVPDVRDQSSRQAEATLTAVGFEVAEIVEVSSEYKDLVVDIIYNKQKVMPGQKLPMGSKLILNIGDGMGSTNSDSTQNVEKVDNAEESWF